jgi:predicted ATPase/DNA-binding SARP family transcriptional activator
MHSPQIATHLSLFLSVLGPLQVRLGTALINHFEFERVRAFLLYMAVEGSCHERAWLAYMFWPDAPLKTGLQNVRQTLAALKRALQEAQRPIPFLTTTPTTIGLNREAGYSLDMDDFCTLIKETNHHIHRRLDSCPTCITHLENAVALYRGDFARGVTVDSEPFEEWLLHKQEQLHWQATRALATLIEYYSPRDEHEKTIQAARRLLGLDPFNDVGHHHLIQALAADNQRYAALKQCRAYETLLRAELGLSLPLATAHLQQQLASEAWNPLLITPPPQHNLPKPLNPLIGYEREQTMIHERLATADCRLLTLSGIAGVGKTRLAIECAWAELANYRDGVFFVDLEAVAPTEVIDTIATLLLPSVGKRDDAAQCLQSYLRNKEMLLILDGFDHLIQSDAASLRQLLRAAPQLQFLITSRERLRVQGESCMDIRGLAYPLQPDAPQLDRYDAVRFFVYRTRRWDPNFVLDAQEDISIVFQMCQKVGGNPCALDLYAQMARFFPLAHLVQTLNLQQLADWGGALNRDLPSRHRSLKSLFYASWRQLSQEERRTLLALSIFQATFTLSAAEAISQSTPDILLCLQAKSCLTVNGFVPMTQVTVGAGTRPAAPATRYQLPELLCYYLRQTLESEPALWERIGHSHAMYYLKLLSQDVQTLEREGGSALILKKIRAESENYEQTITWAIQTGNGVVRAQIQQNLMRVDLYESRLRNVEWQNAPRQWV